MIAFGTMAFVFGRDADSKSASVKPSTPAVTPAPAVTQPE